MEMHSDEIDESQISLLYLIELLVSPYRNVSYTNNQLNHHILKATIAITMKYKKYISTSYLLGISVIGRTLGSDTLFTK